jgi:AraC family transcriptional regulator of arabinose operon
MPRANLPEPPQKPRPVTTQILTGHFHRVSGYATYRQRGTDDWLLIYTIRGAGRFGHSGGEIIARPGDIVLLAPGSFHDYGVQRSAGRWELLWAHFVARPLWLPWLDWPSHVPGMMCLTLPEAKSRRRVLLRLQDAHRLATGGGRLGEPMALNAIEEVLLICAGQHTGDAKRLRDPRIQAGVEFLSGNLGRQMSLKEAAGAAGLSLSRFAHLFKAQMGMTPLAFVETQRLARARQLLEHTPLSIKEIAAEVGFASPFYFTLRFGRMFGISPTRFRRRRGG